MFSFYYRIIIIRLLVALVVIVNHLSTERIIDNASMFINSLTADYENIRLLMWPVWRGYCVFHRQSHENLPQCFYKKRTKFAFR